MATLFTLGSWTSGGYTGTITISYTETTNIIDNTSNLIVTATWSGNRSTATLYGNGLRVRVGSEWWVVIGAGGNANSARSGISKTFVVTHEQDGTGSVTIYADADISGGNPDFKSKSANVILTKIPRGHNFTLSATMLTAGQSVTLTATKNVEEYRSTITWDNGIENGEIAKEQTATSWIISYDTLASGLPTGVTRNVAIICQTMNYETKEVVATITLYVAVNTGNIVLSLYDDGEGNVGATIGERATEAGFHVKGVPADFSEATSLKFREQTGAVISRSSGATIMNQSIRRVGNMVLIHLHLRTSATIAKGSNIFTGTIDKWRPAIEPMEVPSYYGTAVTIGGIWASGEMICRVIADSIPATAEIKLCWQYLTDEE